MKNLARKKVAVMNMPAILKRLQNIENLKSVVLYNGVECEDILTEINDSKDIVALSAWRIIKELSKEYFMIIIPRTVIDEINDVATESTRRILRSALLNCNVIITDYTYDNEIFDFARNTSKKFKCPVDIITYDADFNTQCVVTVFRAQGCFIKVQKSEEKEDDK